MRQLKPKINVAIKLFCSLIFFCLFSCNDVTDRETEKKINELLAYNEFVPLTDSHIRTLDSLRNHVGKKDIPMLSKYYRIKGDYHGGTNLNLRQIYADSLLHLFDEESNIKSYERLYFEALLTKGLSLFLSGKYNQAIVFFLRARAFGLKNLTSCETRGIDERIGNVYLQQRNFAMAAFYYNRNYQAELRCNENGNPEGKFYKIQSLLNNAGYCYELVNDLDRAAIFYQRDIEYIDSIKALNIIALPGMNNAITVVNDNLGSIYLKKGQLDKAETLLRKSLNTPYAGSEGVRIAPLIKLGLLYTQKNNIPLAKQRFREAEQLLEKIPNPQYMARLHQGRALLYAKLGDYRNAYISQRSHKLLKDKIDEEASKLSMINIEKDLAGVEQEFKLQHLKKSDSIKTITLIFTSSILSFLFIIGLLIKRNFDQSKKNSQIVKLNNEELQEGLLKLETANQNYARIMKIMTHDLKNPLAGISSMSALLAGEATTTKKETTALIEIKEAADNALGMIEEVLDLSLFNTHAGKLRRENTNIQLVLQQCISMLQFKANEKSQTLVLTTTDEMIIHANKEKLWRVFNNLIVNAIKFSHVGTKITLRIAELSRHIVISIEDQGIGIPESDKEKVYDVFTEAKRPGTEGEKAYGLGLSISKQIVEAHYGKIWFEHNPKGGTIFFVQLPK
nr:tetratricopeptide repeat-containing sensor histidine kinase [Pedobacter kyonggii]